MRASHHRDRRIGCAWQGGRGVGAGAGGQGGGRRSRGFPARADLDRMELGGVDLTDATQAKVAIDAVAAHFGRLDALINIAGGFAFETIVEAETKTWLRMYALNVLTALHASRASIPHLAASPAARIVNVGAMGALQAGAGMGAYAASKAGVHRLTEALAAEHKGKITVNAVLPSTIDTPANRASMPSADFAKWVAPRNWLIRGLDLEQPSQRSDDPLIPLPLPPHTLSISAPAGIPTLHGATTPRKQRSSNPSYQGRRR